MRSPAPSPVDELADLLPVSFPDARLEPFALDGDIGHPVRIPRFMLQQGHSEPFFDQGVERDLLMSGPFLGGGVEAVGDLYGGRPYQRRWAYSTLNLGPFSPEEMDSSPGSR